MQPDLSQTSRGFIMFSTVPFLLTANIQTKYYYPYVSWYSLEKLPTCRLNSHLEQILINVRIADWIWLGNFGHRSITTLNSGWLWSKDSTLDAKKLNFFCKFFIINRISVVGVGFEFPWGYSMFGRNRRFWTFRPFLFDNTFAN